MKKLSLLVLLTIGLSTLHTYAQDDEFDVTIEEEETSTLVGSFGTQLAKKVSYVNFNGYITNEYFLPQNGTRTFDNHYFNVLISSQLNDNIFIEGMLEYEHAGKDIDLRYAFADYKISDAFVIRAGKFLVPAGEFNEYLYPEYITKTVNRAYVNREITPSAWAEVGVQLRGILPSSGKVSPYYALYLVNGLNGDSGAGIRDLRGNARDSKGGNDNKAVGGAFGIEIGKDIKLSTNYYTGKYTPDGELNLSVYGLSFYVDKEKYSIWSEFHAANQESYNDASDPSLGSTDLNKNGFYIQGGYMLTKKWEPILRYDQINLDGAPEGDRQRVTLGLTYHLGETAILRGNYEFVSDDGTDIKDNLLGFQLSIGF